MATGVWIASGGDRQQAAAASQLPLAICHRHRLACHQEFSFKLEAGLPPLPRRHVVGIPARALTADSLTTVLQELVMPAFPSVTAADLQQQWQQSTTVYLGYEEHHTGSSLRLYFEYWDQVVQRLEQLPPEQLHTWQELDQPLWPMGVGYKWPVAASGPLISTHYWVRPLLNPHQILAKVRGYLRQPGCDSRIDTIIMALTGAVLSRNLQDWPVFLDVREPAGPRSSFDLCCHRHGLRLEACQQALDQLIQTLCGPAWRLHDCLQGQPLNSWLTHISAGINRAGKPYACIYYDPSQD